MTTRSHSNGSPESAPWNGADSLGHQVLTRPDIRLSDGASRSAMGLATVHARHISFLDSLTVRPGAVDGAAAVAVPLGRVWRRPRAEWPSGTAVDLPSPTERRGVVARSAGDSRPVVGASRVLTANVDRMADAAGDEVFEVAEVPPVDPPPASVPTASVSAMSAQVMHRRAAVSPLSRSPSPSSSLPTLPPMPMLSAMPVPMPMPMPVPSTISRLPMLSAMPMPTTARAGAVTAGTPASTLSPAVPSSTPRPVASRHALVDAVEPVRAVVARVAVPVAAALPTAMPPAMPPGAAPERTMGVPHPRDVAVHRVASPTTERPLMSPAAPLERPLALEPSGDRASGSSRPVDRTGPSLGQLPAVVELSIGSQPVGEAVVGESAMARARGVESDSAFRASRAAADRVASSPAHIHRVQAPAGPTAEPVNGGVGVSPVPAFARDHDRGTTPPAAWSADVLSAGSPPAPTALDRLVVAPAPAMPLVARARTQDNDPEQAPAQAQAPAPAPAQADTLARVGRTADRDRAVALDAPPSRIARIPRSAGGPPGEMPLAMRSRADVSTAAVDEVSAAHRPGLLPAPTMPALSLRAATVDDVGTPSMPLQPAGRRTTTLDRDAADSAPAVATPAPRTGAAAVFEEHPLDAPPSRGQASAAGPPSTNPAAPAIDMDELVDKACAEMLLRLAVEQERRGLTRWA